MTKEDWIMFGFVLLFAGMIAWASIAWYSATVAKSVSYK